MSKKKYLLSKIFCLIPNINSNLIFRAVVENLDGNNVEEAKEVKPKDSAVSKKKS